MMMTSSFEVAEPNLTEAWNVTGAHVHRRTFLHWTFYWGHTAEILFSGWPGSSKGMYALALIFVFSLAVVGEWLNQLEMVKPGANRVASGLFKTGFHAVRSGVAYLVILAVMSFNGGVFLVAVFGHAVGFMIFRSRVIRKFCGSGSDQKS